MRTAPWATLALSATCALLSGGFAMLGEGAGSSVGAAVAARPGDQLPHAMRQTKADRLPVRGALPVAALVGEAMAGPLHPLGYAEEPAAAARIFGRLVIDGTLRQEIDGSLNAEVLDDEEGMADAPIALAPEMSAPGLAVPELSARELSARELSAPGAPLPPEKPRHGPVAASAAPLPLGAPPAPGAARASLFATAQPSAGQPAAPSRFGLFSNLGVGGDEAERKLAALTPQGPATPPRGVSVPTPFGVPYVLQTEKVEASCLKPQVVDLLRTIERHYGQKVVMTSGERSRGRDGSLHKTCQAADIIVPGVEAEALARYARGIPGMGGVGTYCHPQMIHIDVGSPRDWHYGCGKSYFAVREATPGAGTSTTLAGRTRMTVTE